MVNKVLLIGNLGADPEVKRLESGAAVAKFSLATNESYKDTAGEWQQSTEWHNCVLWRNLAERAESQLKKGMAIYLEGRLTHRTWQDKDGNNRKTTEVVGSYFRIVSKQEKGESTTSSGSQQPPATPAAKDADYETNSDNGDDLPF